MATINRRKHAQNAKEFLFTIISIHVPENKNRAARNAIFSMYGDLKKRGKHKMPKKHVLFDSDVIRALFMSLCYFFGKVQQVKRMMVIMDRKCKQRTRALPLELEMNKPSAKLRR